MGMFYIDTRSGDFATHTQLNAHGLLDEDGHARRPWYRIQATSDASTLWYALMRKPSHGIWLGALTMRGGDHHAKLLAEGWEEVAPQRTGESLGDGQAELAPTPFDSDGWERLNGRRPPPST
ncbi:MAG: hypothetical protein QOG63_3116, partial [Thermoleophilaceae bacterium]|nr:hypothetical protein [Thermoleophilaceae bacterium]